MNDREVIGQFFRAYRVSGVGDTPVQLVLPGLSEEEGTEGADSVELSIEVPANEWTVRVVGEAPAKGGEYPVRFIDGSLAALPVLCLRPQEGWPIPLLISELGAVGLRLEGRSFNREFVLVERVLSALWPIHSLGPKWKRSRQP